MNSVNDIFPSGLLALYKPKGYLSTAMSAVLKKNWRKIKIGHVGTLDPDAEGVLPLVIGEATKLQDYLVKMPKVYSFRINFGYETDTLDDSGEVVSTAQLPEYTLEEQKRVLESFLGEYDQIPPMYSARRIDGRRLYEVARSSKCDPSLAEKARKIVRIYSLSCAHSDSQGMALTVACGSGTFVRSLGRDIAQKIGTVGTVSNIVRKQSCGLDISDCLTIEELESSSDSLKLRTVSVDKIDIGLPVLQIDDEVAARRLLNGQHLDVASNLLKFDGNKGKFETPSVGSQLATYFNGKMIGICICVLVDPLSVVVKIKRGFSI